MEGRTEQILYRSGAKSCRDVGMEREWNRRRFFMALFLCF